MRDRVVWDALKVVKRTGDSGLLGIFDDIVESLGCTLRMVSGNSQQG